MAVDSDEEASGDSDSAGFSTRRGEAETLFEDLGTDLDDLSRTPGYRGPMRHTRMHFLKLKLYEEYRMSVEIFNRLAPGVAHAAGTMDRHHALGLPILELAGITAYVERRTKLLLFAHRAGLGCPTCSHYDHAAIMATTRRRGLNRSATRWCPSPDFWPRTPS